MKVFTPSSVAEGTRRKDEDGKLRDGSKYLGVLVAAKYARMLNEFRRNQFLAQGEEFDEGPREKLTTLGLEQVAGGDLEYQLVERRRPELL